jgi:hypothetical protein
MQWHDAKIEKSPSLQEVILFFADDFEIGATMGYWEGDIQMWVGVNCGVSDSNVICWTELPDHNRKGINR